ncbi:MAG TPA: cation diffusion facilitator family transporter [Longimicrobiales bacterium]|nr:cation diffusion facilitator family transporter [Longimicrobiales bacterium]
MAHDHDHDHRGRGHRHDREAGRKRLLFVLGITAGFMVIEFVGGVLANSLALMADAGHMLSDVGALGLAVFALSLARRPPTPNKSYGYLRIEILAALANGVTLVVISLLILWQAWERFRDPQPIEGGLMLTVAGAGLAVNIIAAMLLHGASGQSLNLRGAYLHVLGDLLGSVAAIAAAVIILTTGWLAADPLMSCAVAVLILAGSWRLVRESVDILLEGTPRGLDIAGVERAIAAVPGVGPVSDLHVWTLTSGVLAMSGHARIDDLRDYNRILADIHRAMHDKFGISHVTIQLDVLEMYTIGRHA